MLKMSIVLLAIHPANSAETRSMMRQRTLRLTMTSMQRMTMMKKMRRMKMRRMKMRQLREMMLLQQSIHMGIQKSTLLKGVISQAEQQCLTVT